ncbi:MAG: hypothetical protein JXB40_02980 [Candidatus Omnitrophica bacterium]|nr:hypothetical protein [Candidatus Omnitrophota bacterium]
MRFGKTMLIFCAVIAVIAALAIFTGRVTSAQAAGDDNSQVTVKLDKILNNQQSIMTELASIKEELRIIKIRVTQAQ